jgi:hypothetical protein
MPIALLAVLWVDLIVIVVLVGVVFTSRRWVSHQPGAFKGAIRTVEGEVSGLGPSGSAAMPMAGVPGRSHARRPDSV